MSKKEEQNKYTKEDLTFLEAVAESCREQAEYYLKKYKELIDLIKEIENDK